MCMCVCMCVCVRVCVCVSKRGGGRGAEGRGGRTKKDVHTIRSIHTYFSKLLKLSFNIDYMYFWLIYIFF